MSRKAEAPTLLCHLQSERPTRAAQVEDRNDQELDRLYHGHYESNSVTFRICILCDLQVKETMACPKRTSAQNPTKVCRVYLHFPHGMIDRSTYLCCNRDAFLAAPQQEVGHKDFSEALARSRMAQVRCPCSPTTSGQRHSLYSNSTSSTRHMAKNRMPVRSRRYSI